MNNIKALSIGILASTVILYNLSVNCMASNTVNNGINRTKRNYLQEQIATDNTPAIEDYIADSRKKIKNNWYPPTSSFENTATILVVLDKSGKLVDCSLAIPSDDKGFDDSLIRAVEKTKFAPLPAEVTKDYLDIGFTFSMQKRHISK